MTRRDTILVAVIINTALLGFLLFMAITTQEEEKGQDFTDFVMVPPANLQTSGTLESVPFAFTDDSQEDEVDSVLRTFTSSIVIAPHQPIEQVREQEKESEEPSARFVEITVKNGDVLSKIAKANGTTSDAIKKANRMTSDRIVVGQTLKIPVGSTSDTTVAQAKPAIKEITNSDDTQFYVVKKGDNPWKIAKQFNVNYEDILRLNQLDEDKARNMKIGDRIRVR